MGESERETAQIRWQQTDTGDGELTWKSRRRLWNRRTNFKMLFVTSQLYLHWYQFSHCSQCWRGGGCYAGIGGASLKIICVFISGAFHTAHNMTQLWKWRRREGREEGGRQVGKGGACLTDRVSTLHCHQFYITLFSKMFTALKEELHCFHLYIELFSSRGFTCYRLWSRALYC